MFEEMINRVYRALLDGEAILVPNRMDFYCITFFSLFEH